jgi:hypothetical protein
MDVREQTQRARFASSFQKNDFSGANLGEPETGYGVANGHQTTADDCRLAILADQYGLQDHF